MKILQIILFSLCATLTALENNEQLEELYSCHFHGFSKESIKVIPLLGGMESTSYFVDDSQNSYVFRIFSKNQEDIITNHELYSMQQAAKIGISPSVLYVTKDRLGVLMDYIKGETLKIEDAKLLKNSICIAKTLQKAHTIEIPSFPSLNLVARSQWFYNRLLELGKGNGDVERAFEFIQKSGQDLDKITPHKVIVHGDLNPRNIFLKHNGVMLIDWSYSRLDDPFYDLSYLALYHAFTKDEELALLEAYLDAIPTNDEVMRFELTKKMNLANLYLNMYHYTFNALGKDPTISLDLLAIPQLWNHYATVFAIPNEEISLQFTYESALAALKLALSD